MFFFAAAAQANEISVESLLRFCGGSLLFTPPLLSTLTVASTLPHSLCPILPSALALCHPSFLLDLRSPALQSLPLFLVQLLHDDWESRVEHDRSEGESGILGEGSEWLELATCLAAVVDFTSPASAKSQSHAVSLLGV